MCLCMYERSVTSRVVKDNFFRCPMEILRQFSITDRCFTKVTRYFLASGMFPFVMSCTSEFLSDSAKKSTVLKSVLGKGDDDMREGC